MRKLLGTLSMCSAVVLFAGLAQAANITYTGTVTGAFDGNAQSCSSVALGGLSFSCSAGFSATSDSLGHFAIGGIAGNNFGQFTLTSVPATNYNGHSFTLAITFTAPPGTSPNPDTFIATLVGNVVTTNDGVTVQFPTTPRFYSDSLGGFHFGLNQVSLNADNGPVNVTGQGDDVNPAPEPTAMALIGGGFTGLGLLLRRRRKA